MSRPRALVLAQLVFLMVAARVSAGTAQTSDAWTWVVYSSPDSAGATHVQEDYTDLNLVSSVVEANLGRGRTYRVTIGRFATRQAAQKARSLLPTTAPADTWLLRLAEPDVPNTKEAPEEPEVDEEETAEAESPQAKVAPVEPVSADTIEKAPPAGSRWHGGVLVSNVYNSNIDHDPEAITSYGLVPSFSFRFQDHPTDPILTVDYTIARHAYTNTERWDRLSHAGRIELAPEVSRAVRLSTSAEASLRGSAEDRDLSDQYRITQEIEFRLTSSNRLQAYGAARWKRLDEDPLLNSFKPHVGIRLDNRFSGGSRWELGARYERNEADGRERDYSRWKFDTEVRFPALGSRGEIEIGLTFRKKDYDQRLVEVDGNDVLRSDRRYIADIVWRRRFGSGLSLELGYEFQARDSNDSDKIFEAHELLLGLGFEL